MKPAPAIPEYHAFVAGLKERIAAARLAAVRVVNRELVALYWNIGAAIVEKQQSLGWGDAVVEMVAADLRRAFSGMSGFSARNVWDMRRLYESYTSPEILLHAASELEELPAKAILRRAVAELTDKKPTTFLRQLVAEIPWGQNLLILNKASASAARLYSLRATARFGWSRNVLLNQIKAGAYKRSLKAGKAHNFPAALPEHLAEQAEEALKSSYNLEFLSLGRTVKERELEDPAISIRRLDGQGTVADAYSDRPELSRFLKMQRGMSRVLLPKAVIFARNLSNGHRQVPVSTPELSRARGFHPAAWFCPAAVRPALPAPENRAGQPSHRLRFADPTFLRCAHVNARRAPETLSQAASRSPPRFPEPCAYLGASKVAPSALVGWRPIHITPQFFTVKWSVNPLINTQLLEFRATQAQESGRLPRRQNSALIVVKHQGHRNRTVQSLPFLFSKESHLFRERNSNGHDEPSLTKLKRFRKAWLQRGRAPSNAESINDEQLYPSLAWLQRSRVLSNAENSNGSSLSNLLIKVIEECRAEEPANSPHFFSDRPRARNNSLSFAELQYAQTTQDGNVHTHCQPSGRQVIKQYRLSADFRQRDSFGFTAVNARLVEAGENLHLVRQSDRLQPCVKAHRIQQKPIRRQICGRNFVVNSRRKLNASKHRSQQIQSPDRRKSDQRRAISNNMDWSRHVQMHQTPPLLET